MVTTSPPTPTVTVRQPQLAGSRNLRDLGGYRAKDGRSIRWGRLYRSGTLAGLTEDGRAKLREVGLRTICDLRSTDEQRRDPYDWCDAAGISYWARDYPTSFADLRKLMTSALPTTQAAREAMLSGYRLLPYSQGPAYAEIFQRIVQGELPLLFNCSAGKDRAGMAAVLVLTALGVSREDVIEDYLLTNKAWDYRSMLVQTEGGPGTIARQPDGVAEVILLADPDYVAAAFDAIHANSGSLDTYFREVLGAGAEELEIIRDTLLE